MHTVHGYYQCYDAVVILVYVAGKHMCSHVLLARGLCARAHALFSDFNCTWIHIRYAIQNDEWCEFLVFLFFTGKKRMGVVTMMAHRCVVNYIIILAAYSVTLWTYLLSATLIVFCFVWEVRLVQTQWGVFWNSESCK